MRFNWGIAFIALFSVAGGCVSMEPEVLPAIDPLDSLRSQIAENESRIESNREAIAQNSERLDNADSDREDLTARVTATERKTACLHAMTGLRVEENNGGYFVRQRRDSAVMAELKSHCVD